MSTLTLKSHYQKTTENGFLIKFILERIRILHSQLSIPMNSINIYFTNTKILTFNVYNKLQQHHGNN